MVVVAAAVGSLEAPSVAGSTASVSVRFVTVVPFGTVTLVAPAVTVAPGVVTAGTTVTSYVTGAVPRFRRPMVRTSVVAAATSRVANETLTRPGFALSYAITVAPRAAWPSI